MIIDTDRLITVSNFAALKKVTKTAVYKWINTGKERKIEIDGIMFIFAELQDAKQYKNEKR